MERRSRIYIAGHRGLVGSAIVRYLQAHSYSNLVFTSRNETDLTSRESVEKFFSESRPEYVFLAAAKVGGILANTSYPADFIRDNLLIQLNVVETAWKYQTKKLVFLGSSCIYPKFAPQPLKEEHLLTGTLEPSNEWYAVAKIAGIKLSQAYRAQYGFDAINLMPTNLYGPSDNFDLQNSHVLPALIRKFHQARIEGHRSVSIWGTGHPRREFLHVDDMAAACVFLMNHYSSPDIINIGTGEDITIRGLADLVANVVGYTGELVFDVTKPDGTPRKLLDVSKLHALGWKHTIALRDGIRSTYEWYLQNAESARLTTVRPPNAA